MTSGVWAAPPVIVTSVSSGNDRKTWPNPPWNGLEWGGVILSIIGAVCCYPFAKTTWLAVDLIFRPPHREDFITRVK